MQLELYNCVLYQSQLEEMMQHLFFSCPFAKECRWSLLNIDFQTDLIFPEALLQIKVQSHPQFSMLVAILMSGQSGHQEMISSSAAFSHQSTLSRRLLQNKSNDKVKITYIIGLWIQNML